MVTRVKWESGQKGLKVPFGDKQASWVCHMGQIHHSGQVLVKATSGRLEQFCYEGQWSCVSCGKVVQVGRGVKWAT